MEARRFIDQGLRRWGSDGSWLMPLGLLLLETLAVAAIVLRARYTEIDWVAYMQEVRPPFEDGEFDYAQLRGQTGPIAYPAGFVYLYGALRHLAGGDGTDVRAAQWVFALVYISSQALVALGCYRAARPRAMPPWVLAVLCTSLRLHSIYVLRLFNDCWAMLFAWASFALLCHRRWALGCICFSLGVAIKMSVLLFAPGLAVLLLDAHGVGRATAYVALCALVQLALAAPFLAANPLAYVARAFGGFGDLQQRWSVNWCFLPPHVFTSAGFAPALLAAHLACLLALAHCRWCAHDGGIGGFVRRTVLTRRPAARGSRELEAEHILAVLLSCMAVGVIFARSLHYQFYCWYWHSLPFLLWRCEALPWPLKLLALGLLEYAWSYGVDRAEGTPTRLSSVALQLAHAILLFAIWRAPAASSPAARRKRE